MRKKISPRFAALLFTPLLVLSLIFVAAVQFNAGASHASAHTTHSAVATTVNHQRHVTLVPHSAHCITATCDVSFTVHIDSLPPGDVYIVSLSGFAPPQCASNTGDFLLSPDSLGDAKGDAEGFGCKPGVMLVSVLDADKQSEFWFALFTIRAV